MKLKLSRSFLFSFTFFCCFLSISAQKDLKTIRDDKQTDGYVGVALVIGNSDYKHATKLNSPTNDAADMGKTLNSLGFKVLKIRTDASLEEMDSAVAEFGRELAANKGVGIFYYSGHGVQSYGKNYLIPVEASLPSESFLKSRSLDTDVVLETMAKATTKFKIVILDACRTNPFAKSWGYKGEADAGLAGIYSAPRGMLIAYATSPNDTAADGAGRNSPYTKVLLQEIIKPGIRISETFSDVRDILNEQTNGDQTPWESTSLIGRFCFAGCNTNAVLTTNTNPQPVRRNEETNTSAIPKPSLNAVASNTANRQPLPKPNANVLTQQALDAFVMRNLTAVANLSAEALKTDKNLPLALALDGWVNGRRNKKSRANLERVVQIEPQNILFLALLSHLDNNDYRGDKQNDLDQKTAKELADRALSLPAKTDLDFYGRGLSRSVLAELSFGKSYDEKSEIYLAAADEFGKAAELNPKFVAAYYERGMNFSHTQKQTEAVAAFAKIIEILPDRELGYYSRSFVFWYNYCANYVGNLSDSYTVDSALTDIDKAISFNANDAFYFNHRGDLYFYKDEYDKAIVDYTKAIQLNPKWWGFYSDRAKAYKKIGRKDLADADEKMVNKLM